MTMDDMARAAYEGLLNPLAAKLVGHTASEGFWLRKIEGANFMVRWIDDPGLDLATIDGDVLAAAMVMLTNTIRLWSGDMRLVPEPVEALSPLDAARYLLRESILRTPNAGRALQ